ncbi:hypothetical protein [Streptomyces indicus]|uniref:Excreted virulence factor EspC, type VII ESX diderm n=1 Tax=Streptomyces indicus TaxID=417292 RepID=A0A1G8VUB4_9ACTN|nr:hypothetical protein [Streptomyces indicus]SDJ69045.1 hypothetical protein SAMN05421806_10213 [Streptomyces indicus]
MAWDEWERLKSQAAERQGGGQMQLNQLDDPPPGPDGSSFGDLVVGQQDLAKIGNSAHKLYDRLWNEARVAVPSSDKAAGNLTSQGFALGAALQHVSNRWESQLRSLMDACAHINNHLAIVTKQTRDDDDYIRRQMSAIATLDAGFDENWAAADKKNKADS